MVQKVFTEEVFSIEEICFMIKIFPKLPKIR